MDKFIVGVFVGVCSVIALIENMPGSLIKKANDAIKECEKSLPRDQHCKIIAVSVIPTKE